MNLIINENDILTTFFSFDSGRFHYRTKLYDYFATLPDEIVEMIILPLMKEYYSRKVLMIPRNPTPNKYRCHYRLNLSAVTPNSDKCSCITKKGTRCSRDYTYGWYDQISDIMKTAGSRIQEIHNCETIPSSIRHRDTGDLKMCDQHANLFIKHLRNGIMDPFLENIFTSNGYDTRNGYLIRKK